MRRHILTGIIIVFPALLFADITEHECSGHRAFSLLNSPTHVQDSALLLYDVKYYGISLDVNDSSTYITGFTDIQSTAIEEIDELVFEFVSGMAVDSIFLEGKKIISFTHQNDLIKFAPVNVLGQGEDFMVRVFYNGIGGKGGFFSGISNRMDNQWGKRVTYTLSEPLAARDWFVCKQVLIDKADSADVWITVRKDLMAGSNGLLQSVDSIGEDKIRFHWKTNYPIAYYLLSLSVSDYQDYSFYTHIESHSDSILVQNYIYNVPGYLDNAKKDIDKTDDLLVLYSKLFSDYPFRMEKYGHCMAPMGGGMEHQTMTTLSSFRFNLVAHELTHQWYGDNVTCASWQDIWVNEGFASYGEYLALEALVSIKEAGLWMEYAQQLALSEPEGSVYIPEEDAKDIFRIFSMTLSYKKGATLLHMIRYELDDDSLFFETMSEFSNRFSDTVATGLDFMTVLNEVSGNDFKWFFDQWYFGQGFPQFAFTWWYSGDSLIIESDQTGSSSQTPFFKTSMDFNIQFDNGSDSTIRVWINQAHQKFSFPLSIPVNGFTPDPDNFLLKTSQVIRKVISEGYLSVNPNPFGEELNIFFTSGNKDREIILSDLSGKVINKFQSSSETVTIPTYELRQGLYLLQVNEGRESYTTKIVRK